MQAVWTFPLTDNHFALELLAVALLALAGDDGADDALVLQALRWLCVLVLFHAGLQKLLYGHYLRGDFLVFMIATEERFAALLGALLPAGELARLRGLDPLRSGAGPFRVDSWLLVAASNAVWVAELGLAAALLGRRTRRWAWGAALGLVGAIQLGARELGFALLFGNLLLLFAPARLGRRLLPLWFALAAWALAAALGWLPGGPLLDPGSL